MGCLYRGSDPSQQLCRGNRGRRPPGSRGARERLQLHLRSGPPGVQHIWSRERLAGGGEGLVIVADRSLLMIADIGGYTKFMKLHRMSLAHSQDITGRLLKAVVESSPLRMVELEGDAAFFCAPLSRVDSDAVTLSLGMHQAFHSQLERMVALNMCSCDACMQSRNLKVKFVAHVGEVATQTVGGRENLVGVDVIAVHRMLKNAVPVPEYVLMSESP